VTATDISTHLEQMDQLTQQNAELFDRIQEVFTPDEVSEILLNVLGIDNDT
jgi:hypothetical protein